MDPLSARGEIPPSLSSPEIPRLRLAISSCLLGERVRFDGGHKRDTYITEALNAYFDFVPVCPEVAIGMGTPREPIRIVKTSQGLRARGVRHSELDVTDPLRQFGEVMAEELGDIDGYILKKDSPSCGMERVRVHGTGGAPSRTGTGLYAQVFMARRPWLPVEEEGRLNDPVLRENFFERVFVHYRWRQIGAAGITPAALVEFHSRHKFMVMAHSQAAYRRLGRLVAKAGSESLETLAPTYEAELMSALRRRATRKGHTNVLMHLLGFLRAQLDKADRAELLESMESYRLGLVPLIVPMTLLKHHFRRHPNPYVNQQYYLNPHPPELMLRNLI
ncbi:YbgA family protein [Nitrosococcus oceani]|uniref:DUF1722 domain-containing protein n=2 Tax=Nitrosococcus oceani TaxID=1229 RepID=Q3JE26_NITOC|nr:DUF523 and DUF1722 domain-containing protein [Nitrosococcus oceani]ABA56920.1 Protein of unknown function DUF523 [Nitrosococcus oceani ATCC 19707]GEM20830.1 hypothetical protein NONS58_22530 [Nitrosococcus oceani]